MFLDRTTSFIMNAIMVFFVLTIIVAMANSMPNVQDSNDLNENKYLDNVSRENRLKRNVQSSELSPSLRENEEPDCDQCVSEFGENGGCDCLQNQNEACNFTALIPEECYPCSFFHGDEANEYCGFDEGCDTAQGNTDSYGDGCDYYDAYSYECGNYDTDSFKANLMCCACSEPVLGPCDGKVCGDSCTVGIGMAEGTCDGEGNCSFFYDTNECEYIYDGSCTDTSNGATDDYEDGCTEYAKNTNWCGNYNNDDFQSDQMCCACGGGAVADYPDS